MHTKGGRCRRYRTRGGQIEVESRPADIPAFAAVITLHGEHDLTTAPAVVETLRSVAGNVLVELSHCAFLDSTIISALIAAAQEHERNGRYLELLLTPGNETVTRTLDVVGLRRLIVIHRERPTSGDERDR